ncbi:MAG: hypothetical protein CVV44_09625 [Spirochaetae bacterium HGW-Spirochaetae-1]|nr:MAG: hypothetical protein CVV44_09625 [Spirochaetae bacterium HGW-Spirochaetae-1]
MKKNRNIILLIPATVIFISFIMMVNDTMISIRLNELTMLLQDIDRSEGRIDNIGLVTTYETHKKLFENRMTQDKADAIEYKINSLANLKTENNNQFASMFSLFSLPAIRVINFNRLMLGKIPLTYHHENDPVSINVDLAYYYERNFHYKRAIELYDKSLAETNLPDSIRAGILLHQGYCYALSQLDGKARKNYLIIIEKYGRENSAITATVLLRYLEGFSLARQRVLSGKDDSLSQSQQLVNLLDYKRALAILDAVEHEAKPEDISRITYFKARCFAGMGETKRAVDNYLKVVTSDPSSQYARCSNRKLFILGSRSGEKELVEISMQLNTKLNDPELSRMIKENDVNTDNGIEKQNTIKIDLSADTREKIEKIVSQKKEPEMKADRYLVIHTSDGNTFKGTIIEETADHIALKTSIGSINVKKDRIIKITDK